MNLTAEKTGSVSSSLSQTENNGFSADDRLKEVRRLISQADRDAKTRREELDKLTKLENSRLRQELDSVDKNRRINEAEDKKRQDAELSRREYFRSYKNEILKSRELKLKEKRQAQLKEREQQRLRKEAENERMISSYRDREEALLEQKRGRLNEMFGFGGQNGGERRNFDMSDTLIKEAEIEKELELGADTTVEETMSDIQDSSAALPHELAAPAEKAASVTEAEYTDCTVDNHEAEAADEAAAEYAELTENAASAAEGEQASDKADMQSEANTLFAEGTEENADDGAVSAVQTASGESTHTALNTESADECPTCGVTETENSTDTENSTEAEKSPEAESSTEVDNTTDAGDTASDGQNICEGETADAQPSESKEQEQAISESAEAALTEGAEHTAQTESAPDAEPCTDETTGECAEYTENTASAAVGEQAFDKADMPSEERNSSDGQETLEKAEHNAYTGQSSGTGSERCGNSHTEDNDAFILSVPAMSIPVTSGGVSYAGGGYRESTYKAENLPHGMPPYSDTPGYGRAEKYGTDHDFYRDRQDRHYDRAEYSAQRTDTDGRYQRGGTEYYEGYRSGEKPNLYTEYGKNENIRGGSAEGVHSAGLRDFRDYGNNRDFRDNRGFGENRDLRDGRGFEATDRLSAGGGFGEDFEYHRNLERDVYEMTEHLNALADSISNEQRRLEEERERYNRELAELRNLRMQVSDIRERDGGDRFQRIDRITVGLARGAYAAKHYGIDTDYIGDRDYYESGYGYGAPDGTEYMPVRPARANPKTQREREFYGDFGSIASYTGRNESRDAQGGRTGETGLIHNESAAAMGEPYPNLIDSYYPDKTDTDTGYSRGNGDKDIRSQYIADDRRNRDEEDIYNYERELDRRKGKGYGGEEEYAPLTGDGDISEKAFIGKNIYSSLKPLHQKLRKLEKEQRTLSKKKKGMMKDEAAKQDTLILTNYKECISLMCQGLLISLSFKNKAEIRRHKSFIIGYVKKYNSVVDELESLTTMRITRLSKSIVDEVCDTQRLPVLPGIVLIDEREELQPAYYDEEFDIDSRDAKREQLSLIKAHKREEKENRKRQKLSLQIDSDIKEHERGEDTRSRLEILSNIKRKIKISVDVVKMRFDYNISKLKYKYKSADYSFGVDNTQRRQEMKRIKRLKKWYSANKKRAAYLERCDAARYYAVEGIDFESAKFKKKFNKGRFDSLLNRLEVLLLQREELDEKLTNLYTGIGEKAYNVSYNKKISNLKTKYTKRAFKSQTRLASKIRKMHAPETVKEKLYALMNKRTDEICEYETARYNLKHLRLDMKDRRALKRKKRDSLLTIRTIDKDIRYGLKRAERFDNKFKADVTWIIWLVTTAALVIGACVCYYFFREPIMNALRGLYQKLMGG